MQLELAAACINLSKKDNFYKKTVERIMDEMDFILDEAYGAPAPLDPHIASVWITSTANRFIDGYEVNLSANFGTASIELFDDELSLCVELSIKKASINLETKNCAVRPLFEEPESEQSTKKTETITGTHELSGNISGNISRNPEASGSGKLSKNHTKNTEVIRSSFRNKNWRMIGAQTLEVSDDGQNLDGKLISNERAWFIKPDRRAELIVVMAQLTTRASWIEFGAIEEETASGSLGRKIKRWLKTKSERDKELFRLLLTTLAIKGLKSNKRGDALLAVHLEVRSKSDTGANEEQFPTLVVPAAPATRAIQVNSNLIDQYLSAKPRERLAILKSQQVKDEHIQAAQGDGRTKVREERVFNAGVGPLSALAGLEFALSHPEGVDKETWERHTQSRCKQDLQALGLIEVRDGLIFSTVKNSISPELSLKYAAARAPTLVLAREIILEDESIDATSLGAEIAAVFKPNYSSEKSCLRLGGALRRWATYVDPHLFDPELGGKATRLLIANTYEKPKVGAPSLATDEILQLMQRQFEAGRKVDEVARMFGASKAALYLWRKQGRISFGKRMK